MGKIVDKFTYLFSRIIHMDYHKFFDTINFVHQKNGKNRIAIFFDIVYCGFKYQAGYMDYKLFEMYDLNKQQRSTIITRGINNSIFKKYNDPVFIKYFHNKLLFNKKFNKYLCRDWMEIIESDENFSKFKEFCKKHQKIVIKPYSGSCGQNIEIIDVKNKDLKEIYNNLIKTGRTLVEEQAVQCEEISKLHPSSINTIRMVTLNQEIVAAFLRIGNDNNVVDNFNHGGLAAPINIETGIIDYLAISKDGNIYERHPLTNEPILWFQIPKWPRIKRFVIQASKEVPEVGYVGWDVCLGPKDPFLIEANEFPGHDIYQLPPHRTNGQGLLPRFKEVMDKKENKE